MKKLYKFSITSVLVVGIGLFTFSYLNSNADDVGGMNLGACHDSVKSGNKYNECNLKTQYTWNVAEDAFVNNNQFNSWTDYDTVGATTVDTFNPSTLTKLAIKSVAYNSKGEYFQLDDNSWVSSNNFKILPGVALGKMSGVITKKGEELKKVMTHEAGQYTAATKK